MKNVMVSIKIHAPGKKDQLRDSHLYNIKTPMLFFAGTRDALCDLTLLKGVLTQLDNWDLDIVDGGDHSFNLLKSDPRTPEDVYRKITARCLTWLKTEQENP